MDSKDKFEFNWKNLAIVVLTQALPCNCALILVAYAFKFALYAEMNQGCIPSLFSVTGIYIAVLFYFMFKEVLSCSHIFGIALMVPCVICLALDKKQVETSEDIGINLFE